MRHSNTLWMLAIVTAIFVLIFLNLVLGSVSIPLQSVWHIIWNLGNEPITWQNIIWKSRLPQALTALVAGAGLSISGLQMQTVFRNPLAGPSVLGISSGASMGVAFVVLLSGSLGGVALSKLGFMGEIALSIAAVIGSLSVMALIVYVSQKVKGNVTLLIIGVMIGYVANAVIGVLKFFSVEEDIRAYVIWGLGSFARVSGNQMTLFVILMTILNVFPSIITSGLFFILIFQLRLDNLRISCSNGQFINRKLFRPDISGLNRYCHFRLITPQRINPAWVFLPFNLLTTPAIIRSHIYFNLIFYCRTRICSQLSDNGSQI